VVNVEGVSTEGAFAPTGQRSLQAPALAATSFDLGLGGKPAALRISANHPVVAALVAEEGDDFAVTAATPPLTPGDRQSGGLGLVAADRDKTTVLLTAPEGAATVRLGEILAQGPTGTAQDVEVGAGRTVAVTMPPPGGADTYGLSILARPGSGPVYAARLLTVKKAGITLLPVPPARVSALLPYVSLS
jgi:hypothetical protein